MIDQERNISGLTGQHEDSTHTEWATEGIREVEENEPTWRGKMLELKTLSIEQVTFQFYPLLVYTEGFFFLGGGKKCQASGLRVILHSY